MNYYKKFCFMRYWIVLFFVCSFFVKSSWADNKVLVISSYGADYKWSNMIVDGLGDRLKQAYPGVELNVEFLSSEFIKDAERWGEKMDVLLDSYREEPPLAVVLISDEAWMAYQDADLNPFKDVPLLLCAVKPHTITTHDFVRNRDSLRLDHFRPTLEVMAKYNATGVLREMNVSGYLSLMENLINGLDRFVFMTDKRFYGVYTRILLEQEVKKNHPDVPVEYIDARFLNTDSLLSRLAHIPSTAGVLLTSWLTGEHGFEYSKDYIYREMEAKLSTPIFITNDIGLEKGYFVGGYFNDALFWGDRIGDMLVNILGGKKGKEIQPLMFYDDECHIAWKVFERYRLEEAKLPTKVFFHDRPDSFFVVYKYYIIGFSMLFFIFVLFYLSSLRSNFKLQGAQRLLLQSISETREANAKLERTHESLIVALRKAEESDRLKSAFLANMSHEIRTPLNAIVGFSGVIAEVDDKDERVEFAGHIQRSSDLLLQLISDILDISKIEAGALKLSFQSIDALDACTNVVTSLQSKCKPGVKLFLSDSCRSMSLCTDQNRLMQVVINLVNNAAKFTLEGSIEVGYFSCNDGRVEFFVKDTGMGISSDKLTSIFDRFVKLNSLVEGTGLGLSISKTIVGMLEGEMGVESTVGVGSRFWFRIPKDGCKGRSK